MVYFVGYFPEIYIKNHLTRRHIRKSNIYLLQLVRSLEIMSLYELKTKSSFYDPGDGRKLEGLDEKNRNLAT